jgi:hypothetical protein
MVDQLAITNAGPAVARTNCWSPAPSSAAAVARFLADVRRLARAKLRDERDRLLTTIGPSQMRPAATPAPGTRPPDDRKHQ